MLETTAKTGLCQISDDRLAGRRVVVWHWSGVSLDCQIARMFGLRKGSPDRESPGMVETDTRDQGVASVTSNGRLVLGHPSGDLYGSDRMAARTASLLRDRGWDVTVSLNSHGLLVEELEGMGFAPEFLPGPVLRKTLLKPFMLPKFLLLFALAIIRSYRFLRRQRADALLVNTVTIPFWLVAATLARVPAVVHVREAETELSALLQKILLSPLFLAKSIIANSEATAKSISSSWPALGARTVVVYNGLFETVPTPDFSEGRSGHLVCVGRLSPRKGQNVAIEAIGYLRDLGYDVTLDIVGDCFPGYEPYVEELETLVSDFDIQDRVVFKGFQTNVSAFYRDASLALTPSLQEPFGNVAVEAMILGTPVIASRVQGLAEIIDDDVTGVLVPVGNAHAIADAVRRLIETPELRDRIARNGFESVSRRFTMSRYANDIAFVLDELPGRRNIRLIDLSDDASHVSSDIEGCIEFRPDRSKSNLRDPNSSTASAGKPARVDSVKTKVVEFQPNAAQVDVLAQNPSAPSKEGPS